MSFWHQVAVVLQWSLCRAMQSAAVIQICTEWTGLYWMNLWWNSPLMVSVSLFYLTSLATRLYQTYSQNCCTGCSTSVVGSKIGQKIAIFWQSRLRGFRVLLLRLNFPKMGMFGRKFGIFGKHILWRAEIHANFPYPHSHHNASHWEVVLAHCF